MLHLPPTARSVALGLALSLVAGLGPGSASAFVEFEDSPFLDPTATEDNDAGAPMPIPWDLAPFLLAEPDGVKRVRGQIDAGDTDWIELHLSAGQLLVLALFSDDGGDFVDLQLGVFAPASGVPVIDDDAGPGLGAQLAVPITQSGSWRVAVSGFKDDLFDGSHEEGDAGLVGYQLVVAVAEPGLVANETAGLDAAGGMLAGALGPGELDSFPIDLEEGDRLTASVYDLATGLIVPGGDFDDPVVGARAPGGALAASDDDSGPGLLASRAWTVGAGQGGAWSVDVSAFPDLALDGSHAAEPFDYLLVVTRERACPSPVPVISSLTPPSTGKPYALAFLAEGDHYYTDRTDAGSHVLTDIADDLECSHWIKTANGDKGVTSANHLQFSLGQAAEVYVGYDTRAAQRPDWLTTVFLDLNQILDIADSDLSQEFALYRLLVPAGALTLGGNRAGPPAGLSAGSNYTVFARPLVPRPDALALYGTAVGGSIDFRIDQQLFSVSTSPGDSAATVRAAIAAAINGNATLAGLGLGATVVGDEVQVDFTISDLAINDAGLAATAPVPVPLWPYLTH